MVRRIVIGALVVGAVVTGYGIQRARAANRRQLAEGDAAFREARPL